jgi:hypothetical protein
MPTKEQRAAAIRSARGTRERMNSLMSHIPTSHEVETYTGRYVDTKHPDPATISVKDIAHALANTCRYGGHCQRFYSVAEHAVFCSWRVERGGYGKDYAISALHHDDAEAYLGDIPRPMKSLLGRTYALLSERMDAAIVQALGLTETQSRFHDPAVKSADNWALFVEARHLLPSQGRHWFNGDQGASTWGLEDQPRRIITPNYWHGGLDPEVAEALFLGRHRQLLPNKEEA